MLKSCGLEQQIRTPTHITETTASCIDRIIVNREDMYYMWDTLDLGLSDHQLIYTSRKKRKLPKEGTHITCRNYNKLIDINVQDDIKNMNWDNVLNCNDTSQAAELFTTLFNSICDKHAPLRTINMKSNAPAWLNGDYLAHRDEKKYHCKNFNRNPTPENKILKDDAISRTNELRTSLQWSYFQDAVSNYPGDMKNMW